MKALYEEFQIRKLTVNDVVDFQNLVELFKDVFEMNESTFEKPSNLYSLLKRPDFIVFVAENENEIIGGLTAYELPMYYGKYSELFIYDIAVKRDFQRNGVGKLLLSAIKSYCKQNGIREMFVDANEEDIHALDFYDATGGKADKVIQFTYLNEE